MPETLTTVASPEAKPKKENARAVQAFEDYYLLGVSRSLEKLLAKYQSEPELAPTSRLSTLKQWSRQHSWQNRVLERTQVDLETQRLQLSKEANELRKKLSEVRRKRFAKMQRSAVRIIEKASIKTMTEDDARARLGTAVKMLAEGAKGERLELGESTENISVAIHPPKPLDRMSEAELDAYIAKLSAGVSQGAS